MWRKTIRQRIRTPDKNYQVSALYPAWLRSSGTIRRGGRAQKTPKSLTTREQGIRQRIRTPNKNDIRCPEVTIQWN
ncbi:MAG: hypothetical protein ACR2KF_08540 [Nitrososphaeraceae archaeon]